MKFVRACAAAAAILAATATPAQTPAPPVAAVNLDSVQAVSGAWSYRATVGGSEADFADTGGHVRLTLRCNRASRTVSLVRSGIATAAPALVITTTYGTRSLPASFAAGSLTAQVAANDSLLDDIAFTRGKWAVASAGAGPLVLPSWADGPRVIEDCRS